MERLRIEYETGYMELNIEAFFPLQDAGGKEGCEAHQFILF